MRRALLVVGLSACDAEGAVHLLEKHDARKVVGERHRAEAEAFVGLVKDCRRKTQRPADDERHMASPVQPKPLQVLREALAVLLSASHIEADDVRVRWKHLGEVGCFGSTRLRVATAGRITVGNFDHTNVGVGTKALEVLLARIAPEALLEATHRQNRDAHANSATVRVGTQDGFELALGLAPHDANPDGVAHLVLANRGEHILDTTDFSPAQLNHDVTAPES